MRGQTGVVQPLDIDLPYLDNPFRPPDWRWRVAGEYNRTPNEAHLRRSVDFAVLEAAALQSELGDARGVTARSRVLAKHGALGSALRLYTAARADSGLVGDPALMVAELDGYILAGLSDADAARESGIPTDVVSAYVEAFFDVRERLHNGAWISASVIGSTYAGDMRTLARALVRLYGYAKRSPVVVKGMARAVEVAGGSAATLYEAVLEDARTVLAVKAAIAARQVQLEGRMFRSVVEMQIKRMEVDRSAGEAMGDARRLADAISVLLQDRSDFEYNQAPADAPPRLALPEAVVTNGEPVS